MQDVSVKLDTPDDGVVCKHEPASGDWVAWTAAAVLCVGILVYALVRAFVWDEGFHLLAAQLILDGKKPYIDFCFPQTLLNAYWNAAWIAVFGATWRVPHIPAALELGAAVLLQTRYLLTRFPVKAWRVPCALVGMLLFAANSVLVEFGPVAQAYALCALAAMGSYLLTIAAARRSTPWLAFAAGLTAGAGAASSLLIAPVLPVLWIWLFARHREGARTLKLIAFVAGAVLPFAPVIWLFVQSPFVTFFNVVQYQALFRRADWDTAIAAGHDFVVLTDWVDCGQTLLMAVFVLLAVRDVWRNPDLSDQQKEEFWLAFWCSVALIVYVSTAHPTFGRYYIIGLPLYAIVAVPGFMIMAGRLMPAVRPFWPVALFTAVMLMSLGRSLFDERDGATWPRYEEISREIAKVTPRSANLMADELVYYLLHWKPPSGLEFSYSHKVDVAPKQAALLHIIPTKQLQELIRRGTYATIETCDDDHVDQWKLVDLYKQRKDVADCSIFWDLKHPTPSK